MTRWWGLGLAALLAGACMAAMVWGAGALGRWVETGRAGVAVTAGSVAAAPDRDLTNPLPADPDTVALGRRLFMQNCAFWGGRRGGSRTVAESHF